MPSLPRQLSSGRLICDWFFEARLSTAIGGREGRGRGGAGRPAHLRAPMADEAGLGGTGAGRAARDPSSLEVLGSSSSDENKTLLTSSLYMTGNKTGGAGSMLMSTSTLQLQPSQLSPANGKGGRPGHFPARKSTELRVNARRSAAPRPGGAVPNIQTSPEGLATLSGGGQIMTALLPPGMQPRQNHATGIEVHRYSDSPQTLSSPNLTSGIAGTLSPARKVDFPELSPAGAVSVQGQGAEAHGSEAATPREAGEEQEGRDLQKVLARLSKKPDSTEFVYLRPYLPDADAPVSERLTPLNPYHIEVVTHSQGTHRRWRARFLTRTHARLHCSCALS